MCSEGSALGLLKIVWYLQLKNIRRNFLIVGRIVKTKWFFVRDEDTLEEFS